MSRRKSRIETMSLLYEISITGETEIQNIDVSKLDKFSLDIFTKFIDNREEVDETISNVLHKWTLKSISKIDLALLRLATTEHLFMDDVPSNVSVNEAVEIAKVYGDDNSPSFINSLMRKIVN